LKTEKLKAQFKANVKGTRTLQFPLEQAASTRWHNGSIATRNKNKRKPICTMTWKELKWVDTKR